MRREELTIFSYVTINSMIYFLIELYNFVYDLLINNARKL